RNARGVGNFEVAVGQARHQTDAAGVIQKIRPITERLVLVGGVVDRNGTVGRILDANPVVIVAAVQVVAYFSLRTAVFKTWIQRVVGAAVHPHFAAGLERAAFGVDVHDTRGAEAILRGQRAGDEAHGIREARAEFRSETGDAFGQKHVVDAILQVRV